MIHQNVEANQRRWWVNRIIEAHAHAIRSSCGGSAILGEREHQNIKRLFLLMRSHPTARSTTCIASVIILVKLIRHYDNPPQSK